MIKPYKSLDEWGNPVFEFSQEVKNEWKNETGRLPSCDGFVVDMSPFYDDVNKFQKETGLILGYYNHESLRIEYYLNEYKKFMKDRRIKKLERILNGD